ncbi:MAG: hypothetical protein RRY33_05715 [Alistipes sp.]
MNRIKFLLSVLLLLAMCACKTDPWEDIAGAEWSHDHAIIEIKFEGQAGTPVITMLDEKSGVIELQLASDKVSDLSNVKIELLTLSYHATATVATGGTIDFTQSDPTILVTSATGESRTYALKMKEFSETLVGTYTISTLWVYGGTGPEWDCSKLYKPYDKSWCWNSKGRGPEAEIDNYLVFTLNEIMADGNTTGKCMNWAGVDAHNWDSTYAAKENKEGKDPIDLSNFYRQIPKGESTWVRNYTDGKIYFTDAQGKQTNCTLIDKGTYNLYDGKIMLTLSSSAFKFNLKGSDYWDAAASDYDVFAKNPRNYFIEVVKQAAGFAVPDAAKTTEEASEPDPEPEPDAPTLASAYNVSDLKVYGGTDSPAFVGVVDKSWVWDDTIWKEKDNTLDFTATGTDASNREIGICNYQAGADKMYWNYILKADFNLDKTGMLNLAKYYGQLPHGKSAYVYDATAGTIVITQGSVSVTAKVLFEGTYTYGSQTTFVSDMALDFTTPGEEVWNQDHLWTDYDRFAVCPRNYLMFFVKQATPNPVE